MTDRYAVIGNPIAQSKSPLIHALFAQATGQDIEYTRIEAPLDGFAAMVRRFREQGGRGLNVTAPFKLEALAIATEARPAAQQAGAANALAFDGERIVAENFDGVGLVRDLVVNLATALAGARVLMLGAGGAVRGALHPLLAERPQRVVVVNRTVEKARGLLAGFGDEPRLQACGYAELAGQRFDLVIDGTSAGLFGQGLPLPAGVFEGVRLAYEMVYGKGLTPFLRQARDAGVPRLADGVGMLVEQAAEAFAWWRGVRPGTKQVIERLAVALE